MSPSRAETLTKRIRIQAADPTPIWGQVEESLRRLLASTDFVPGEPFPSVREFAADLRVNPARVSKAYQRLVGAGLLEVRQADGTYVSATLPALRNSEQSRLIREAAMNFVSHAITHGAELETAREALDQAWDELSNNEEGAKR
jgi:GntR family transcriptional regulator